VSGGNTCTGGGWSISPSILSVIFCSAMRWSPAASAHKAAYRHPASHGVGSRLLAARRRRVAKKAVSLAKLLGSAWLFTGQSPLCCVGVVRTQSSRRGVAKPSRSPKSCQSQSHPCLMYLKRGLQLRVNNVSSPKRKNGEGAQEDFRRSARSDVAQHSDARFAFGRTVHLRSLVGTFDL
jgi:hypothetical protein